MSVTQSPSLMVSQQMSTPRRRRVLLIAYSFPPVGGAGVQRPTKWVKYLPPCGWDVTVLTPENPSVPLRDESLLAEIPPETRIIRARTWEPDYRLKQQIGAATHETKQPGMTGKLLRAMKSAVKSAALSVLQPDLQVLWVRNAVRAAAAELRNVEHDAILVTAPPYSMLSIGVALKQRFALPLVFDFRDEWDLSSRYLEQAPRGWWSSWIQARMQRWLLRHADAVLATTQASALTYQRKLSEVGNIATSHCVYNGFDPEDFPADPSPRNSSDTFRLVYTGTLWNLTDIEPLVLAIERLQAEQFPLLSRLELAFVGRKTPQQQRMLDRLLQVRCRTEFHDYCPHDAVAEWLRGADALCLTLSDAPGAERVVPAKLFEYLAVGKPLLSIVPHGETARIARRLWPDGHFVPRDVIGIAQWLKDRLLQQNPWSAERISPEAIQPFSRPVLTRQLADVLNAVTGDRLARPESLRRAWSPGSSSTPLEDSRRATRTEDISEQESPTGEWIGAS